MLESNAPLSPRAAPVEWLLVILLSVNLIWTTLGLGGYRPETMLVTSLLTALTLVVQLIGWGWTKGKMRLHPVGWLGLPFLIYATANVIWVTPVPWVGWHDWVLWAHIIITFWIVLNGVHHRRPLTVLLLVIGGLALVATMLAAYQRFVQPDWLMLGRVQADQFLSRSSGPFGIPNSLAAFYLLIIPGIWVLALRRRATALQRVFFGYLGLCTAVGLFFTVSRGGWAGLAAALMLWPLLARKRRWSWRLGVMLGAVGGLALAGWTLHSFSPIVRERIQAMINESGEWTRPVMWHGAWALFREHAVLGSGAGSYNVLFEKYRPEIYQQEPQWAHNDYLNTLSDYGSVGFLLIFGMAGAVTLVGLGRRSRDESVPGLRHALDEPLFWQAVAVGLLAFALQLLVDFHFKIPALGMLFALLAALLVQRVWPSQLQVENKPRLRSRAISGLVLLALVWGVGVGLYPFYRGEALRYSARQALDTLWRHEASEPIYRATLSGARQDLQLATEINPRNAQAWSDLAMATSLQAHVTPERVAELGRAAEIYADRALGFSRVVPEFWIRKSVASDMQGKWLDGGNEMIQAMLLAPANASVWLYQGFHLSLQPASMPQARAALDYCLRLDPANPSAKHLRQQLATKR
ncbi:MAG: O-antigen ligase family protein [Cephaloticoccus sp.]|nr:O-antigen ligase family protein [Cephaloticoccus sp.]MCF7759180.1 O-antigen ligase family protein [Cephaloticoccus sp.]